MQTYDIKAHAQSAINDGATVTANGATMTIGGAAPNTHANLRFDTSAITAAEEIVQATLTAKVESVGAGTQPQVAAWAADFGAAITIADYALATSTVRGAYRLLLSTATNPFLDDDVIAGGIGSLLIPSAYIKKDAGAYSDFDLRPVAATVGATDTVVIHGPAAVAAADKPALAIITLSSAELAQSNPFRWQAIGAESFLAFAREPSEGTAVKGCVILDASNITLALNPTNYQGNAFSSNRVKPRKTAVGRTNAGGGANFDLTPEKCVQLFPGVLKLIDTVDNGGGSYTHTFKVAESREVASFTMITKKGAFRMVYPGCKLSSLSLSVGLGNIVTAAVEMGALTEWRFDYTSVGLADEYIMDENAAYDTALNGLWSDVHGSVNIDGNPGDFVQRFDIVFHNDLRPRAGLNGKRGPTSHFPLGFSVSTEFDMYFENEVVCRKYMGNQALGYPYEAGMEIVFDSVELVLSREESIHELRINIPKLTYETIDEAVSNEDVIELKCRGIATYDEAEATNVILTLTTAEPASAFDPSTNYITVKPLTNA